MVPSGRATSAKDLLRIAVPRARVRAAGLVLAVRYRGADPWWASASLETAPKEVHNVRLRVTGSWIGRASPYDRSSSGT